MSFRHNHIEIGMGCIITDETKTILKDGRFVKRLDGLLTGRVGYRHQMSDKKLFFRLAFTPIIEYGRHWEVHPTGGGSIVFSF